VCAPARRASIAPVRLCESGTQRPDELLWALLLGVVFAVGAWKGGRSALRYYRIVIWGGGAALGSTLVWALITGQWQRFIAEFGWQPILEMLLGAALLLFTMIWMGGTYVSTKLRTDPERSGVPEHSGGGADA
jgi:hypothetical protein